MVGSDGSADTCCLAVTDFGILFLFIGAALLWRVNTILRATSARSATQLYVFGGLVLASGASCFLLDEHIFQLSPIVKIPLYTMLGTSITFAFAFSIVDLVNVSTAAFGDACCGAVTRIRRATGARDDEDKAQVGLIETAGQINLILFVSAFLGFLFGFVFGLLDIEDKRGAELRHTLWADELYFCYPVGVLAGGLTGWVNHKLREDEEERLRRFKRGTQSAGIGHGVFEDDEFNVNGDGDSGAF